MIIFVMTVFYDVGRWETISRWINQSRWTASIGLPERREKVKSLYGKVRQKFINTETNYVYSSLYRTRRCLVAHVDRVIYVWNSLPSSVNFTSLMAFRRSLLIMLILVVTYIVYWNSFIQGGGSSALCLVYLLFLRAAVSATCRALLSGSVCLSYYCVTSDVRANIKYYCTKVRK